MVRRAAAESLGTAGADPETAAALERTLTTDLAYGARAAAVRSLASIAAPRAWDAALEAAKQPSERDAVRSAALEALRKIDAPRAIPILLDAARVGQSYESRERALGLLVSCATERDSKMTPEARADLRAALAAAAESNNWRFRLAALRQMGQLDDPELAPILDKVSKESRDARDRRTAEAALASRKGREKPAK